ncbi:MAG: FtsK/SpoIIIE domain-containing protein [Candidatus Dormibacteraeota bacterium]|nr:FtsK/SpoIIIE domain-containing protein [Candidatus Dormibacteraeota bacterium]
MTTVQTTGRRLAVRALAAIARAARALGRRLLARLPAWMRDPVALVAGAVAGIGSWFLLGRLFYLLGAGVWLLLAALLAAFIAYRRLRLRVGFPERARSQVEALLPGDGRRVWVTRARKKDGAWELTMRLRNPVQAPTVLRAEAAIGLALDASVTLWVERRRLRLRAGTGRLPKTVDYDRFYRRRAPDGALVVGLGMSQAGPLWCDLAKLPHLLVGGSTGMGKSAFMRQLITRLAATHGPDRLRLAIVDLKGGGGVELGIFEGLPHLAFAVARNLTACVGLLEQLEVDMEARFRAFGNEGVADIEEWNARHSEARTDGPGLLPRVLLVMDEVAELSPAEAADIDQAEAQVRWAALKSVARVTRLGRAAGIHVLAATQRPDVNVLPGQIRANIAATVAFRTSKLADSQILLREDNTLAAWLPPEPGRAIWQHGPDSQMFQAIWLGREGVERELGPMREAARKAA